MMVFEPNPVGDMLVTGIGLVVVALGWLFYVVERRKQLKRHAARRERELPAE